ncbi:MULTISPECIES: cytochrome b/b6 domain-containing protein [unclassified Neisseria]|uniref:cytochrome b/b6 domain-containing protein n=1 Tax=unclassified Neisseria TaxID=2623750 RepID=UPI001072D7AC|nr:MULTISPECIES: cytochrome b/b6 domain-containing protein [unclassified Neisseria]MBF0803958.1 cytochrome b/b6 domain-containing protein [Neisseria sp. 19428wB4_WF04]TFU43299.1 nickel-dependent hydrogenase b-type cytochrome subunit [Neisseria sp. WF04]
MKQKLKVWDLPTRIFHWTLAAATAFMWYSAETGGNLLIWHLRVGLLILVLVVFRICWGLWGSDTARFANFVRGPGQIARYLKGEISENEQPGHNPLGALMVLALLAAVLFQVATGLFANDENTFTNSGYLNGWAGDGLGSTLRTVHVTFFNALLGLICIHVATIFIYKFLKKHDLIKPMITGYKFIEGKLPALAFAGSGKLAAALAVAAAVAAAVWFAGTAG